MQSIMAGINQTIMLSLSMVIIASMIGAGFEGGIAVVILAVILDRITQSLGKPRASFWRTVFHRSAQPQMASAVTG